MWHKPAPMLLSGSAKHINLSYFILAEIHSEKKCLRNKSLMIKITPFPWNLKTFCSPCEDFYQPKLILQAFFCYLSCRADSAAANLFCCITNVEIHSFWLSYGFEDLLLSYSPVSHCSVQLNHFEITLTQCSWENLYYSIEEVGYYLFGLHFTFTWGKVRGYVYVKSFFLNMNMLSLYISNWFFFLYLWTGLILGKQECTLDLKTDNVLGQSNLWSSKIRSWDKALNNLAL